MPSSIAVFISHSKLDQEIAESLTEVIKNSLEINPRLIRCTSVEGHRLQGGVVADDQLRQEIIGSQSFIGLLTPQSLGSTYVLFELGARWGAGRRLIPLLAAGFKYSDLKGPLTAIHGHSCGSASEIHQLVDELAEILKVNKRPTSSYQRYVERLVEASDDAKNRNSKIRKDKKRNPAAKSSSATSLSRGQSRGDQRLASAANPLISLEISKADFRANQSGPTDPVFVNIYFQLETEYRGQKTTLSAYDIHINELSLNKTHSYFSGDRNEVLSHISLEPGYSGILKYTVTGIATNTIKEIPSQITGQVIFKETFAGNLPELPFKAMRDS